MPQPRWLSNRLALAIATLIAVASFVVGQISEGLGMSVAIGASTLWVAYSIWRQRRLEQEQA